MRLPASLRIWSGLTLVAPKPAPRWTSREAVGLAAILLASAVALTWRLGDSTMQNQYYSAIAQAGARSWSAFLWTSPDIGAGAASDKPPLSFWPMVASVRAFGLQGWAIALPQVLEGLATIALTHLTIRRVASPFAGLVAAAATATTPIFFALSRFNSPDALLTLTTIATAYAAVRAVESPGARRWQLAVGALLGAGFLTKWLAAAIPAIGILLAVVWSAARAGGRPAGRRAFASMLGAAAVTGGWWVVLYLLSPTPPRPFPDSRTGNVFDLILGQNGFSRIGYVLPNAPSDINGYPGFARLFIAPFAGQVGWLLPLVLTALLFVGIRVVRTRLVPTGWLIFGAWFLTTWLAFSLMRGAMHPYYTALMAPAIGGCLGLAAHEVRGRGLAGRVALGAAIVATAPYAGWILGAHPSLTSWRPWLLAGAAVALLALAIGPRLAPAAWRPVVASAAAIALLGGPTAYALSTLSHTLTGFNPVAGPVETEKGHPDQPQALIDFLNTHTEGSSRWAAAVPTAPPANQLQLQSGRSILPLGGFTGRAGFPKVAWMERAVAAGELRYIVLLGPYRHRTDPQGMLDSTTWTTMQWALSRGCRFTLEGTDISIIDLAPDCSAS